MPESSPDHFQNYPPKQDPPQPKRQYDLERPKIGYLKKKGLSTAVEAFLDKFKNEDDNGVSKSTDQKLPYSYMNNMNPS